MLGGGDARTDRAFERLYRRHVREVYRYAGAVLGNPADAEDVTQTAFLNAYRAFQSGTRPDEPLNWLIAITHNVCRQRFREGSRRPREVGLDRELAFEPSAEERFQREDILRAFSQLGLNQRAALAMRELEGRSYAEIGSVLGMTKAAVETLIFRARRSFREQLEGSLTCNEAERAISLQLDGVLPRTERGSLRAHLRGCPECALLARRYRAQRSAFKGIGLVPLPPSLAGGFGLTSGAAVGTAIGVKAVAFGTAALVAAVGTEVAVTQTHAKPTPAPVKSLRATPAPAEQSPPAVLASASVALLAQPAATNTPLRTIPAKAKATSRASSSPPAHVASGPPVPAAVAQPIARVAAALAAQQADAPKRDTTAARQQPQLSGGGHPADGGSRGLAVDHGHQQSGQVADVHGSSGVARDHPAHPTQPTHPSHPDHPAHPDNPGQGQGQGQGQGGQTATPTPDPPTDGPTVTDVTVPTVPDPPPAAPTPPGNGTPPAEPPGQAKPPKPLKPGGNPHGGLLPRLG